MRARCSRCGARFEIRVHFDRDCEEVTGGAHYHRICNCGYRWIEQCGRDAAGCYYHFIWEGTHDRMD
jgi:hypothetical protein